jgi:hypothetical protein
MVWASPAELPTDPKSNAIVFLDELNSAAPAVQAAAYQLILNRRVGQYVLPAGVAIVAAGAALVLFAGMPLMKVCLYAALAWGIWSIIKSEF